MKDLGQKYIRSTLMKSSIIYVLDGSKCVPGTCPPTLYVELILT